MVSAALQLGGQEVRLDGEALVVVEGTVAEYRGPAPTGGVRIVYAPAIELPGRIVQRRVEPVERSQWKRCAASTSGASPGTLPTTAIL